MTSPEHILYITRWYPNEDNPQLGIFIRKQAKAASLYCCISVLNVIAVKPGDFLVEVESNTEGNFSETYFFYKQSSSRLISYLRFIKAHFNGYSYISKNYGKPQLMQVNVMLGLSLVTLLLHYRYKIPYLVSEHWHGFVSYKFEKLGYSVKKLLRYCAGKAVAIITVSESLKKGMLNYGFNANYIVVPNIVESKPVEINSKNEELIFLTVADLDDEIKNISSVINSLASVKANGQKGFQYHIIGSGKDADKLFKLTQASGFSDDEIVFHGLQSNDYVLDFVNRVDCIIINSFYETFSVIAAEALLAGKPLICTKCGGIDDFVDNECGILIEPDNNLQLKNAIITMLQNARHYDSKKLKQKVSMRFNSDVVGKQLNEIYRSYIKS